MTTRDDTLPNAELDTEPGPMRRRGTDPTWPPPSASENDTVLDPPDGAEPNDTDPATARTELDAPSAPGLDTILGGIGERAPKIAQIAKESAGREAAQYQVVAKPVRARTDVPVDAPAVLVRADTEPVLPVAVAPRAVPSREPPADRALPAEKPSSAPAPVAKTKDVVPTAPGRRRREARARRQIFVAVVLAAALLPLIALLAVRPWRRSSVDPSSAPSTASARAPSSATVAPTAALPSVPAHANPAHASSATVVATTSAPAADTAPKSSPAQSSSAARPGQGRPAGAPPPRATEPARVPPVPPAKPEPPPTSPTSPGQENPPPANDHVRNI